MSLKRRRLSGDSDIDIEESGETRGASARKEIPIADLERHQEHWYEDGSVVLATDVHLFRVHKSMLAKHSTMFNDMFRLPAAEDVGVRECCEGLPVVRMGDADEEVCIVLRALYDRKFMSWMEKMTLSSASSLLIISTQYEFHEVQSDTIKYLKWVFPMSYDLYGLSITRMASIGATCPQLFVLLRTASLRNINTILPALYLACTRMPIDNIVPHLHLLPEECVKKLLSGRDWVLKFAYRMIMQSAEIVRHNPETVDDVTCARRFRVFKDKFIKHDLDPRPILPFVTEHFDLQEVQSAMCRFCANRFLTYIATNSKFFWNKLPAVFGLGDWGNLHS